SRSGWPTRSASARSASASARITPLARSRSPVEPSTLVLSVTGFFSAVAVIVMSFTVAAVRLDQLCPFTSRLEERLGELPDGAGAPAARGLPARLGPDLRDGVGDRHREADSPHRREIGQVIADEGNLIPGQA